MKLTRSAIISTLNAVANLLKASTGAECALVELAPDRWYGFIQNYDSGDSDSDSDEDEYEDDGFDPDWIDVVGPASSEDKAWSLLMKRHANPGASDSVPFPSLTDSEFKFWSQLAKSLNRKISVPEAREEPKPVAAPKAPAKKEEPPPVAKPKVETKPDIPTELEPAMAWMTARVRNGKDGLSYTGKVAVARALENLQAAPPKAIAALNDLIKGQPSDAKTMWKELKIQDGPLTIESGIQKGQWKSTTDAATQDSKKYVLTLPYGAFYLGSSSTQIVKGKLGFYFFSKEPAPDNALSFWSVPKKQPIAPKSTPEAPVDTTVANVVKVLGKCTTSNGETMLNESWGVELYTYMGATYLNLSLHLPNATKRTKTITLGAEQLTKSEPQAITPAARKFLAVGIKAAIASNVARMAK